MLAEFESTGKSLIKNFVIDDENRGQISAVLDYFFSDSPGLSRAKGIALIGGYGAGKSTIFRIIRMMLPKDSIFAFVTALNVANDYAVSGERIMDKYRKMGEMIIDDAGEEKDKHRFGNHVNSVGELLSMRYELFQSAGHITHLSSNLTPEELGLRYGPRIQSRIYEMFHIIHFNGNSDRRMGSEPLSIPRKNAATSSTVSDEMKKKIEDDFMRDVWQLPLEKYMKTGDVSVFQDFSMQEVFRVLYKRKMITLSSQQVKYYEDQGKRTYYRDKGIEHSCPFKSIERSGQSSSGIPGLIARENSIEGKIKKNAALLFMWDLIHAERNKSIKSKSE